jgi:hypothetical protein
VGSHAGPAAAIRNVFDRTTDNDGVWVIEVSYFVIRGSNFIEDWWVPKQCEI